MDKGELGRFGRSVVIFDFAIQVYTDGESAIVLQ